MVSAALCLDLSADGQAIAGAFSALFAVALAVLPVIVAAVLTAGAPLALRAPLLTVGAAGYGLALAWAGVRIAAITGEGKITVTAEEDAELVLVDAR